MKAFRIAGILLVASLPQCPSVIASTNQEAPQPLDPLENIVTRINWEDPNLSDVAYVGTRAGALFSTVAEFVRRGNDSDKKLAEEIKKKAIVFLHVGRVLHTGVNGGTEEGFARRYKLLLERYTKMMAESKTLNNSIASQQVRSDTNAANSVFPAYQQLFARMTDKK